MKTVVSPVQTNLMALIEAMHLKETKEARRIRRAAKKPKCPTSKRYLIWTLMHFCSMTKMTLKPSSTKDPCLMGRKLQEWETTKSRLTKSEAFRSVRTYSEKTSLAKIISIKRASTRGCQAPRLLTLLNRARIMTTWKSLSLQEGATEAWTQQITRLFRLESTLI